MKYFALIGTFLGFSIALAGPVKADWMVDPAGSRIGFTAFSRMHDVEGSFSTWRFEGKISDNWQGSGRVVLTASSVESKSSKRDAHLRNEDFFDVPKFPELMFVIDSSSVKPSADGAGDLLILSGRLTIHGTTKPLRLELRRTVNGTTAELTGETSINRRDFGIAYNSFVNPIKDEVRLKFRVSLRRE